MNAKESPRGKRYRKRRAAGETPGPIPVIEDHHDYHDHMPRDEKPATA